MQKEKTFTLVEHLTELRKRLIIVIFSLLILSVFSYFFSSYLIKIISLPVKKLYFVSPVDAFLIKIKISILSGLVLSSPVIFYQIWKFIEPGLILTEKKYLRFFILPAILLFFLGVIFGAFTVPVAISVLLRFSTPELIPWLTADKYFSFFINIVLAFGVVFEFPVVVAFLLKIGILSEETLKRHRKYSIIAIFVLSAIITPTQDIITLLLMSLPLLLFYEGSIILARFIKKEEKSS